jgi:hypothetical protein
MRLRFRTSAAAYLLAAALAVAGCADKKPKLVPVVGKVVYKGQALTAGSIWFHPDAANSVQSEKSSCQLGEDGSFTMRTYPHGDGVPPGAYKVTLSPELANRIKMSAYSDPAKTPWKLDVPDGGILNQVFEVK